MSTWASWLAIWELCWKARVVSMLKRKKKKRRKKLKHLFFFLTFHLEMLQSDPINAIHTKCGSSWVVTLCPGHHSSSEETAKQALVCFWATKMQNKIWYQFCLALKAVTSPYASMWDLGPWTHQPGLPAALWTLLCWPVLCSQSSEVSGYSFALSSTSVQ